MSTNKTYNLNLHSWVGSDKVLRTEFVDNFNIIDEKFSSSNGHSHSPFKKGEGARIDSGDVIYNEEVNDTRNLRQIIDELFQGANSINKSVAKTIGVEYNELGNTIENSMASLVTKTRLYKDEIMNAINQKHGIALEDESLYDYYDKILDIPYNLRPTGTARPEDVSQGKTFINNYGTVLTGTHPVFTKEFTPGKQDIPITDGIHRNSKIKAEPNLKPENILKGKTIFNVKGTLEPKEGLYKLNTYSMDYFLPLFDAKKTVVDSGYKCLDSVYEKTVFACQDGCNGIVYTYKRSDTATDIFTATHKDKKGILKTRNFNVSGSVYYFSCDTFNYYYSTESKVYAFDRNTSSLKWSYTSNNNDILGAFPAPSGNVWICTSTKECLITCVNSQTGEVINTSVLGDYSNTTTIDKMYVDNHLGKLFILQTGDALITEVDLYQDDTKNLLSSIFQVNLEYHWASYGNFKGMCTDLDGTIYYAVTTGNIENPRSAIFVKKVDESQFKRIDIPRNLWILNIYPYMPYRYKEETRVDTKDMLVLVTDLGVKVFSMKNNMFLEEKDSDDLDILRVNSTAMDDRGNIAYIDKNNMITYHVDFLDKFKVVNPKK
jgi:hypothetical protein